MNRGEHIILSLRIEISGLVLCTGSSDGTTWRERGADVLFLDDPQCEGGSSGCVVCFYDPRFVLLHANHAIVINPDFPLVRR